MNNEKYRTEGCTGRERREHSYGNIRRIAEKSLAFVQDNIVVYQDKKDIAIFNYCCETDYREEKGNKIIVLYNNNRNSIV